MPSLPFIVITLLAALGVSAFGQDRKLPKPTRTVYRCEVGGVVRYTDEPCLAGQKVDVTPTRGMDKASGQRKTGADVRKERTQEQLAEVMRPVFGEDTAERATRHRRARLSPAARTECEGLDVSIEGLEARERAAGPQDLPTVQRSLLNDRARHKSLGC